MCKEEFNPLKAFAKRGTGFLDGKKRIYKFFLENKNNKERVDFLKKEFGTGGFAYHTSKANILTGGHTSCKGIKLEYNSSAEFNLEKEYKWKDLVDCIDEMIEKGEYVNEEV